MITTSTIIIHQVFWSFSSPEAAKTGENPIIFPNFQNFFCISYLFIFNVYIVLRGDSTSLGLKFEVVLKGNC